MDLTKHYNAEGKGEISVKMRLWLQLSWDVEDGKCWKWRGALNNGNYGVIKDEGKTHLVHRKVYEIIHGVKLKRNDFILHLCDNRTCSNPDHLFCGTQSDNMFDKHLKNIKGEFKKLSDNYARFLYEKLKVRFETEDKGKGCEKYV